MDDGEMDITAERGNGQLRCHTIMDLRSEGAQAGGGATLFISGEARPDYSEAEL
jgi:hypothetical protein